MPSCLIFLYYIFIITDMLFTLEFQKTMSTLCSEHFVMFFLDILLSFKLHLHNYLLLLYFVSFLCCLIKFSVVEKVLVRSYDAV